MKSSPATAKDRTVSSVTPPLDFAYGEAVVTPPDILLRDPNAARTVDQVFARLIEAEGGAARVNALTSYVATLSYGRMPNARYRPSQLEYDESLDFLCNKLAKTGVELMKVPKVAI
jgi:hypothetical protein